MTRCQRSRQRGAGHFPTHCYFKPSVPLTKKQQLFRLQPGSVWATHLTAVRPGSDSAAGSESGRTVTSLEKAKAVRVFLSLISQVQSSGPRARYGVKRDDRSRRPFQELTRGQRSKHKSQSSSRSSTLSGRFIKTRLELCKSL